MLNVNFQNKQIAVCPLSVSSSPSSSLSLPPFLCALHSAGRQWGWEIFFGSLLPLLGWDRPWSVLLAGSVEGKRGGSEGGGEGRERGLGEEGDWRGGGVVCSW